MLLVLVGGLLLAAVGLPAPAAIAGRKTHKVAAEGTFPAFRFNPSALEVAVGDKVVWTNTTSSEHHIQPYGGPWVDKAHLHLAADGGKASFVFKKPGAYQYYCDITYHGQLLPGGLCLGQCGSITVN